MVSDGALIDLGVTLAAVPQPWLGPVFAALGHAAGCPGLELRPVDDTEPGLFGWRDTVAGVALPPTRSRYGQVQGPYLVPDAPVVGGRRVG